MVKLLQVTQLLSCDYDMEVKSKNLKGFQWVKRFIVSL